MAISILEIKITNYNRKFYFKFVLKNLIKNTNEWIGSYSVRRVLVHNNVLCKHSLFPV